MHSNNHSNTQVTIIDVPIGAPRERHSRCGDLIEFDYAWNDEACDYLYDANGEIAMEPCCKTCGPIPADQIEIS